MASSEGGTNPVGPVAELITIINLVYFIISFVNLEQHQDSENECVVDLRNYLITCPILHCSILFIAMMYARHPRSCGNEDTFQCSCVWTFWIALPIFIWSCRQLYTTDEVCVDTLKTDYSLIWVTINLEVYTWLVSVALFASACLYKYCIDRREDARYEKLQNEYDASLKQPGGQITFQPTYGSTNRLTTPLLPTTK